MPSITSWLVATRPQTLVVSIAPVLLGQTLAWQESEITQTTLPDFWLLTTLAFMCALSLQVAVNLANDYYDARYGIDTAFRLGESRVTAGGFFPPEQVLKAALIALMTGVLAGFILSIKAQPLLLILGLICVVCVWCYSAGPVPLAHYALGEFVVFWVFGPIAVMGTFYSQMGHVNHVILFPALTMGLFAAAIMLVNNIRDMRTDAAAGKTTIAILIGDKASRSLYVAMLLTASASTLLYFKQSQNTAITIYLALMASAYLCLTIYHHSGEQLNQQLQHTAQLMLLSSVLFVVDVFL